MTASVDSVTGQVDYTDYGKDGTTRVVGIYIDPLVISGEVIKDSDFDSQRRFQNDLEIDNLLAKTAGDFDGDGDIVFPLKGFLPFLPVSLGGGPSGAQEPWESNCF